MAAVADALHVGKTNVYPEECLFLYEQNAAPSMMEAIHYDQRAVRYLADDPRELCHMGDSVLVSAAGRWGTEPRLKPGQPWCVEVLIAEPHITSVPTTMITSS